MYLITKYLYVWLEYTAEFETNTLPLGLLFSADKTNFVSHKHKTQDLFVHSQLYNFLHVRLSFGVY